MAGVCPPASLVVVEPRPAKKRWPAPAVPGSCERRKEHIDATKDLANSTLERQMSRRDVPLREKTLWRMLY
jgi:hypothetical protein